jgi:hypothetical protein
MNRIPRRRKIERSQRPYVENGAGQILEINTKRQRQPDPTPRRIA